MATHTVSAKIPEKLNDQLGQIAKIEKRTSSNVVRMAIEYYVSAFFELHPQFREDILESRAAIRDGDVEEYEFG